MESPSIFERILSGEIPAKKEYEDDHCIVIHDINPQAPLHLLIIPKKRIHRIREAHPSDKNLLGHLLYVSQILAENNNCINGYRLVINNGHDGGESVPHLHIHFLAKRQMLWPPG